MVGGHDAHHVDIVALEHLAIVAVLVGLSLADFGVVSSRTGVIGVHVADGHDIAEPVVLAGVTGAHAAEADAADPRTIVGRLVGKGPLAPSEIGDGGSGGTGK